MPSTIQYDNHERIVRKLVLANARASQLHRQMLDEGKYYMNGIYEKNNGSGTKAQDAERKRLNNIALKYTGKNLNEIDEKAVMSQKPSSGDLNITGSLRNDKDEKKKKKAVRRITPTLLSVPDEKKSKSVEVKVVKKRKNLKNTISCEKGYKIVKSKVKSTNPNDKRKLRGNKLKEIMKSQGISLMKASKYMKANNIKY